jgi:HK97 family phage major capsid protein
MTNIQMLKNFKASGNTFAKGKSYTVEDEVAQSWLDAGLAAASSLDDVVQGLQETFGGDDTAEADTEEQTEAIVRNVMASMTKGNKANKSFKAPTVNVVEEPKSFGDFTKAVCLGQYAKLDQKYQAVRTKSTQNEGTTTAGGFLVPQIYVEQLLSVEGYDPLWRKANTVPMQSNIVHYPVLDQTSTPSAGQSAFNGGVVCGFVAEGAAPGSTTQAAFKQVTLTAHKILGYTQITNELLQDSPIAVDTVLTTLFGEAVNSLMDYSILLGTGDSGSPPQPQGIIGDASVVDLPRTTVNQVVLTDFAKMYARLPSKSRKRSCWVVSPLVLTQLITMLTTGSNGYLVWYPGMNVQEGFGELRLFGLPVYECEQSPTLGHAGDVMLIDFSKYLIGIRRELEIFGSPVYAMTSDVYTVRFSLRVAAKPQITAPVVLADGSTQVSPFVELSNSTS